MTIDDIETPAVLIDESIARANIAAYQSYCDMHGLQLRPHIKTHKLPQLAKAQLEAGAKGITCQKISEAEVMASHGIDDILITYNMLGERKLQRLRRLAENTRRLAVTADNQTVIDGLARAFGAAPRPLEVLVECDTGAARCGVQSPQEAVALAQRIHHAGGLSLRGLMTYPAAGCGGEAQKFLAVAKDALREQSLPCDAISSGGTPDMWRAHTAPEVTEYRVGTYIYNDRSLLESGVCAVTSCALQVLATVVSTPTPARAVIDAGSKILTCDLNGLQHYGVLLGRDNLVVGGLSEEHGIIVALDGGATKLSIGKRVRIIPNHCCVVSNMVDSVTLHHNGHSCTQVTVDARGCVT